MTTWPLLLATFVAISLPQLLTADPIDQVRIRAWGENALRIQIAPSNWTLTDDLPTAYLPVTSHHQSSESGDPIVSGNIKGEIDVRGMLRVTRLHDSKVLFQETARSFNRLQDSFVTFDFSSVATKLYGMGQNRHQNNGPGLRLNVINETYSFQSSISEEGGPSNSLPFTIASSGSCFEFGVLFNSPTLGSAMFNATSMTWSIVGEAGNQFVRRQFDFLVTTHAANASNKEKPFQIVEKYVDAVGHARKQPYAGYWHSRNRYKSQDELLEVARGFHNRSIPVDVIVIDYHHWKIFGDWSFDERYWPDPQAMVDECRSYGIEIMVSVWPFTCPGSRSYDAVMKNGWFTSRVGADGKRSSVPIETHGKNCRLVDPTNPDFRKYIWASSRLATTTMASRYSGWMRPNRRVSDLLPLTRPGPPEICVIWLQCSHCIGAAYSMMAFVLTMKMTLSCFRDLDGLARGATVLYSGAGTSDPQWMLVTGKYRPLCPNLRNPMVDNGHWRLQWW